MTSHFLQCMHGDSQHAWQEVYVVNCVCVCVCVCVVSMCVCIDNKEGGGPSGLYCEQECMLQ